MIPVVGMFRGLFLGSVLVWYSSSVWKTMDNYYNQEFKKYLQKEKQERRFPSENVCHALPEEPSAAVTGADPRAAAHDSDSSSREGDGGVGGGGVGDGGEGEETLSASASPESSASDADGRGGALGGCTVNCDVTTHTGQWCRREEIGTSGEGSRTSHEHVDDGDTCPAQY